jgi:hypothetical protein
MGTGQGYRTGTATTAVPRSKPRKLRFSGWGNARDDAAHYARLTSSLGPQLRPVRPPDGPKPPHIPGQIPLWGGEGMP